MVPMRFALPLAALVLLEVTGCSRGRSARQQATPSSVPSDAPPSARGEPTAPDASRPTGDERERGDSGRGALTDHDWSALQTNIYFDFDRSDLSAEARSALAAKLPILLANPDMAIQIVGHADERGSDEYNLALGLERAAAAKRYLTQRGVSADRISVISMGEERPVCTESNESCWWRNRRDEFLVTTAARPRRP